MSRKLDAFCVFTVYANPMRRRGSAVIFEEVNMEPLLLTVPEAARLLNVGRNRVYTMVASGILPHVNLGERSIRIPLSALKQWLSSLETQGDGAENSGEVVTSGTGAR